MFEKAEFGSVVYNGTEYDFDVYVHPSGDVQVRRKELSEIVYNTGHKVVAAEIEYLLKEDPDCVIIGTGFSGALRLTSQAREVLEAKNIFYTELLTPQAAQEFNNRKNCAMLVHVTC
jgi:hypothetical protein